MKYYDEKKMREIREVLEGEVLKWPGVSTKEMMGCLCYFYRKKFFAFLVTKGIVITKLPEGNRIELSKKADTEPFEMSGRVAKSWIRVAVRTPSDVDLVLPSLKKSYEAAVEM